MKNKIKFLVMVLITVLSVSSINALDIDDYTISSNEGAESYFGSPNVALNSKKEYVSLGENFYRPNSYNEDRLILTSGKMGVDGITEKILDIEPTVNRQVPYDSAINDNGDFIFIAYSSSGVAYKSYLIYGNRSNLDATQVINITAYDTALFLNAVKLMNDGTYIIGAEKENSFAKEDALLIKGKFTDLGTNALANDEIITLSNFSNDDKGHYTTKIRIIDNDTFAFMGYTNKNSVRQIFMGKGSISNFNEASITTTIFGDGTSNNGYNYGFEVNSKGDYVVGYFESNGTSVQKYRFGNMANLSLFTVDELSPNPPAINSYKVGINGKGEIILSGSSRDAIDSSLPTPTNYDIFIIKRKVSDPSYIKKESLQYELTFNNVFTADLDDDGNIILAGELLIGTSTTLSGQTGTGHGYIPMIITGDFDSDVYSTRLFGNNAYPKSTNTSSSYSDIKIIDNSALVIGTLTTGTKTISHFTTLIYNKAVYVVDFNTDGGSSVASQDVTAGASATRPTSNPTKNGYTFVDWYTDTTYSTLFDFSQAINSNKTVYAKFVVKDDPIKYTVSFDTDGGTKIANQLVAYNDLAIRPQNNPVKDGYTFVDWYTSKDFKTKFAYTTKITKNTIIYAKYNKKTIIKDDTNKPPINDDTKKNLPDGGSNIKVLILIMSLLGVTSTYVYRVRKVL